MNQVFKITIAGAQQITAGEIKKAIAGLLKPAREADIAVAVDHLPDETPAQSGVE